MGNFNLIEKVKESIRTKRYALPMMPANAMRLLNLLNNADSDIVEIEKVASLDQLIAGEIVKIANSSAYGSRVVVNSLKNAIARIGRKELRGVIFAISIKICLLKKGQYLFYMKQVWQEALHVAFISRFLAKKFEMDPEQLFLAGLMHNIGKMAILSIFHDLSHNAPEGACIDPDLLDMIFEAHHLDIGKKVMNSWNFPADIIKIIELQDKGDALLVGKKFSKNEAMVAVLLSLAIDLCHMIDDDDGEMDPKILEKRMRFLQLSSKDLPDLMDECEEAMNAIDSIA